MLHHVDAMSGFLLRIRWQRMRSASTIGALLLLIELSIVGAQAECRSDGGLKASVSREAGVDVCELREPGRLSAYEVIDGRMADTPSTSFNLGSRVVICMVPSSSMYISVWDTPPKGNIERLFPNSISHPNGERAVLIQSEEKLCIGSIGSGYKVTISEYEGMGHGQFYVLGTKNYEQHPGEKDFALADWQTSMKASIEKEGTGEKDNLEPIFSRAADARLIYVVKK